jgi:ABC-type Mn2+/Zn2+ transport system ATPase subunit
LLAGGHREAHLRAKEFVEATAVKYGFSSKVLAELGGGEKQRVLEFAAGFVFGLSCLIIERRV